MSNNYKCDIEELKLYSKSSSWLRWFFFPSALKSSLDAWKPEDNPMSIYTAYCHSTTPFLRWLLSGLNRFSSKPLTKACASFYQANSNTLGVKEFDVLKDSANPQLLEEIIASLKIKLANRTMDSLIVDALLDEAKYIVNLINVDESRETLISNAVFNLDAFCASVSRYSEFRPIESPWVLLHDTDLLNGQLRQENIFQMIDRRVPSDSPVFKTFISKGWLKGQVAQHNFDVFINLMKLTEWATPEMLDVICKKLESHSKGPNDSLPTAASYFNDIQLNTKKNHKLLIELVIQRKKDLEKDGWNIKLNRISQPKQKFAREALDRLQSANLLSEDNFQAVIVNCDNPLDAFCVLFELNRAGLLDGNDTDAMAYRNALKNHRYLSTLASMLRTLNVNNFLNPSTAKMVYDATQNNADASPLIFGLELLSDSGLLKTEKANQNLANLIKYSMILFGSEYMRNYWRYRSIGNKSNDRSQKAAQQEWNNIIKLFTQNGVSDDPVEGTIQLLTHLDQLDQMQPIKALELLCEVKHDNSEHQEQHVDQLMVRVRQIPGLIDYLEIKVRNQNLQDVRQALLERKVSGTDMVFFETIAVIRRLEIALAGLFEVRGEIGQPANLSLGINTHTASVHTSSSESAKKLFSRYITEDATATIEDSIINMKAWVKQLPRDNLIYRSAQDCIDRLTAVDYVYIDPDSQVTMRQLIALTWMAIQDDDTRIGNKADAEYLFLMGLYESQRGGNLSDTFEDNLAESDSICPGGTFNKFLEKLHGIHPDVVIINITPGIMVYKLQAIVLEEARIFLNRSTNTQTADSVWSSIKTVVANRLFEEFGTLFPDGQQSSKFQSTIDLGQEVDLQDMVIQYNQLLVTQPPTSLLREKRVAFYSQFFNSENKNNSSGETDVAQRQTSNP